MIEAISQIPAGQYEASRIYSEVIRRRARCHAAANARVAAELGISERTVEDHVAAILIKAQVATRAELIATLHA